MQENGKPTKMALLVIDVQKGLFERSTPIYQAETFLENLNTLIGRARQSDVPVIFAQHSNEKMLVKGSDAWQLHPRIQPNPDEIVLHKLHGDAFIETSLEDELQKRNVGVLFITGLVTQGCVRATSLGAIERGYKVMLVSDAHSTYSKGASQIIQKWNQALLERGAVLIQTQDVDLAQN
ncbi:MAG: cysteine hydrolase family protein [Anaerolineales bacterium]